MKFKYLSLLVALAGISPKIALASGPNIVQGNLTVMVEDYFTQHRAKSRYFVDDNSGRKIELMLSGKAGEGLTTGMVVRSSGNIRGSSLLNADMSIIQRPRRHGGISTQSLTQAVSPSGIALPEITPSSGPQSTLIYNLVSSTGAQVPNFTNAQLETIVFATFGNSVNTFYERNSNNSVSFNGKTIGIYQIIMPSTCDFNSIQSQADKLAISDGVDITQFSHHLYMMPSEMSQFCNFEGLSTIGGHPSDSWINTGFYNKIDYRILYTTNHELGHSLSMGHAQSYEADGKTLDEYGDNSCVMGDGAEDAVNFNVPHMIQQGWLPLSSVQQVMAPGIFTINVPQNQGMAIPQALQIALPGTAGNLYVSYLQPSVNGGDSLPPGFLTGASIHYWTGGNAKTQLATNVPWGGALYDGQSYNSNDGKVTITQISHDANTVTVEVKQAMGIPDPNPTIVNSASGMLAVAPGSLATVYGITILGVTAQAATTSPLPTNLGGIQVLVNGTPSALLYVAGTQINFQVPASTQVPSNGDVGTADVKILFNNQRVAEQATAPVKQRSVGIYTVPNPTAGQPALLNAVFAYYNGNAPAVPHYTVIANPQVPNTLMLNPISLDPSLGTAFLSIYATGINGGPNAVPTVLINGVPTATSYSGSQNTYPGLDQINIALPPTLSGLVTVALPYYSQEVQIQIGN